MTARLDPMWENALAPLPWMSYASCAGMDPEIWFRVGGNGGAYMHINDKARAICSWCPVRRDCDEYALSDDHLDGIWAGRSKRERAQERTRRKAASDE